eukprot:TRINITY_DN6202_c0_g1_i1.p1 TRINITY_DN6202_c0_g1~~TRINITY_DN6202_c0_g1_i1.p1  ORF type:complete len:171 (-),score=14.80 TRINITY_DN6202_c0_g1_i1:12-524(-)
MMLLELVYMLGVWCLWRGSILSYASSPQQDYAVTRYYHGDSCTGEMAYAEYRLDFSNCLPQMCNSPSNTSSFTISCENQPPKPQPGYFVRYQYGTYNCAGEIVEAQVFPANCTLWSDDSDASSDVYQFLTHSANQVQRYQCTDPVCAPGSCTIVQTQPMGCDGFDKWDIS